MVNIQSFVHITNTVVISYNSVSSYLAAIAANTVDPNWGQKMTQLRTLHAAAEQRMSVKYNIPLNMLDNVCLIFGTVANTEKHMSDIAIRTLLCDLNNRIVVQMRTDLEKCDIVSTVYRAFDYQIFTHSFKFRYTNPNASEQ